MEKNRREIVDPVPVEWPLGVSVPESLDMKMARMIRTSMSELAERSGQESFDEADDFDVADPEEPRESVHELDDDQERIARDHSMVRQIPVQFRQAFEREIARRRAAAQKDSVEKSSVAPEQAPKKDGTVTPT